MKQRKRKSETKKDQVIIGKMKKGKSKMEAQKRKEKKKE